MLIKHTINDKKGIQSPKKRQKNGIRHLKNDKKRI